MIVNIDKSNMSTTKRNEAHDPLLDEYISEVSMLRPMAKFVAVDTQVKNSWRDVIGENNKKERKAFSFLSEVTLYENGEKLGEIGIEHTYRSSDGHLSVYYVNSFRIEKQRGYSNRTVTKHLKVALRNAKKAFVPRVDEELASNIKAIVSNNINSCVGRAFTEARWCLNTDQEAMFYAYEAYKAHKAGSSTVILPTKLKSIKNDSEEFYKKMDLYEECIKLHDHYINSRGYAIQKRVDNSYVVFNYDVSDPCNLRKYKSLDDLPKNIADKLAVLKLLSVGEAVGHIGVKFTSEDDSGSEYYYLLHGDILFE
jgi:hypothetical protein